MIDINFVLKMEKDEIKKLFILFRDFLKEKEKSVRLQIDGFNIDIDVNDPKASMLVFII